MQSNGTLTDTSLRTLLEMAQSERATGTLNVRNGGGGSCTLYFLFGHLFHAVGEGMLGDEAVVRALGWRTGEFNYDPKAKLPADETVRGSITDLVVESESRPAAKEPEPEPAVTEPVAGDAELQVEETPVPEPAPEPVMEQRPEESPPAHLPEPEPEPAPTTAAAPVPAAPPPAPTPSRLERADSRPATRAPEERRGVKHRPSPRHGREPIPVPEGQVIYDSLKTSFVDFPRLITTLERESYTGYVRLLTDEAAGLILFRDGAALECAYDAGEDPALQLGTDALIQFNDAVTNGQGVLDVVSLSAELVDGLYELTVAKPLYSDLYASWVDPDALLKFLEKRKLSGSVMVRAGGNTGVIILTDGQLTGAYTSDSRDISDSAQGVLKICDDREAVIEVKSANHTKHQPLDVDAIVGSRRVPSGTTQTAMPVYQPEPEPAPEIRPPDPVSTQPTIPAFTPTPVPEPSWHEAPAAVHVQPPGPGATQDLPAVQAVGGQVDWEQVIAELQATTEEDLGNRARKVKDLLAASDRSAAGIEATINQIPGISILFVDAGRLESLAHKLRARLHGYLA